MNEAYNIEAIAKRNAQYEGSNTPTAQREREVTAALNNLMNKVSFILEVSENLEKRIEPVLIHPDAVQGDAVTKDSEVRHNMFTTPLANSIQAQVYRLEHITNKICKMLDMLEI